MKYHFQYDGFLFFLCLYIFVKLDLSFHLFEIRDSQSSVGEKIAAVHFTTDRIPYSLTRPLKYNEAITFLQ